MSSRNSFASILMTCFLAIGFLGVAPVANAASGAQSFVKSGKGAKSNVPKIKVRGRGARILLPIGPGQVYCDYPYYYSRGHYPTHIPGYVYYPYYYRNYC